MSPGASIKRLSLQCILEDQYDWLYVAERSTPGSKNLKRTFRAFQ